MVGGWGNCDPVCTFLDTTEVFTTSSGSWRLISSTLPSAMQGGYVATVSNIVYMLGDIGILQNYFFLLIFYLKVDMMELILKMIFFNMNQMVRNGNMLAI